MLWRPGGVRFLHLNDTAEISNVTFFFFSNAQKEVCACIECPLFALHVKHNCPCTI